MANLSCFMFDSDDEDEGQNEKATKVYKIRRIPFEQNYRSLYRFTPENVQFLIEQFMPEYEETRGGALNNVQKMHAFLRYVGDPGFQVLKIAICVRQILKSNLRFIQVGVGEDVGIHQSTVSYTIWKVCTKITAKAEQWIHFPSTKREFQKAKRLWRQKFKFPCAFGAIDCTLIPIKKPSHHGDEYICRKNFAALNVQATCDANYMFTSVDCSWAGSVHDARIWRNSSVQHVLSKNESGALLLGDEGYPLLPWLMTVYRNPTTDTQRSYNKLHKTERSIIERMFGQIKNRFPILQNKIRIATKRIPSFIIACFILHNVAKYLNDPDFETETNIPDNGTYTSELGDYNQTSLRRRGEVRRNQVANIIAGF